MGIAENLSNPYSWLITFLIYDNAWYDKEHKDEIGYISLEKQKEALYAAISALNMHERVKVVLIEAKINVPKKTLEIWMRTKAKGDALKTKPLQNPDGSLAMSNDISLQNILKPIVEENSADHHIVITVGHGSIFGINLYSEKDDTQLPDHSFINLASQKNTTELTSEILSVFEKNKRLAAELPGTLAGTINIQPQLDNLFGKIKDTGQKYYELWVPELNLTVLTIKEIDSALKSVFKRTPPVDILVLDNCLMQNIFTQFELCETVGYLVAPMSGISYPGFNYTAIIEKICADINIGVNIIANDFVSKEVIHSHSEYPNFKKDIERRWCLNSIKLDQNIYTEIKRNFVDFFKLLNNLITSVNNEVSNEIYQVVKATNAQLFGYNSYSLPTIKIIDLHVFLIFFKELIDVNLILTNEKEQLLKKIENLKISISKVAVNSYIGDRFYPSENYYKDEDNMQRIGFGFMMPIRPTKKNLVDNIYIKNGDTKYTPNFLLNSDYFNFIKYLWKMSP